MNAQTTTTTTTGAQWGGLKPLKDVYGDEWMFDAEARATKLNELFWKLARNMGTHGDIAYGSQYERKLVQTELDKLVVLSGDNLDRVATYLGL